MIRKVLLSLLIGRGLEGFSVPILQVPIGYLGGTASSGLLKISLSLVCAALERSFLRSIIDTGGPDRHVAHAKGGLNIRVMRSTGKVRLAPSPMPARSTARRASTGSRRLPRVPRRQSAYSDSLPRLTTRSVLLPFIERRLRL